MKFGTNNLYMWRLFLLKKNLYLKMEPLISPCIPAVQLASDF